MLWQTASTTPASAETRGCSSRRTSKRWLRRLLRGRAPSAVFDEEYARLRPLLADVWPSAERTESLGLRREGAGRVNTEAVTTVSNEGQFTRYARLRHMLVLRARAESL